MKLNKSNQSGIVNVLAFGRNGSAGYPVVAEKDGLCRKANFLGDAIRDIPGHFSIVDGKATGLPANLPKSLACSWFNTWCDGLSSGAKLVALTKAQTEQAFQKISGATIGGKPIIGVEKSAYKAVFEQNQKWPKQVAVLMPNGSIGDGLVSHAAMSRHSHLTVSGLPVPTAKVQPKAEKKPAQVKSAPAKPAPKTGANTKAAKAIAGKIAKKF